MEFNNLVAQNMSLNTTSRKYLKARHEVMPLTNLIQIQIDAYGWFLKKGLKELFAEISPITDFSGKDFELHFKDYYLDEPKFNEKTARTKNATFEASLRVEVRLINKRTGEIKEQEIYLGEIPLMTERGTFIINGVERVIVSQLIRSPGAFFTFEQIGEKNFYGAKVIPNRGCWLEIETESSGAIFVKVDRKRKAPLTTLLKALDCAKSNEELIRLFKDVDNNKDISYIKETIRKDPSKNPDEGLKEIYKRIRPGDLATVDNARSLIYAMFFDFDRYDFGHVGRFKINQRLNLDIPQTKKGRVLQRKDLIGITKEIIRLNNSQEECDDIDHLGNRRVRAVGELIQNRFRVGLARLERIAKDRMSTLDINTLTPSQLINARPVIAATREFFMSSQLSQFMDQTNPLAELEHKRRLSAMGPGGLQRKRAGFDVRDVHSSHYGRICPIATPEGPNIGLVGHLACFARLNEYGFIETPYRQVIKKVKNQPEFLTGEILDQIIKDKNKTTAKIGDKVSKNLAKQISRLTEYKEIKVKSRVSRQVDYLNAFKEERVVTAPATTPYDSDGYFTVNKAYARVKGEPQLVSCSQIDYIDVSPKQIVSLATSLIPFLEHDDANRALMGTNMQRQAVSCIKPQAPLVGTGSEMAAAEYSGHVTICRQDGRAVAVSAEKIKIKEKGGKIREYELRNFLRSNSSTCIHEQPIINKGDKVKAGQILTNSSSIDRGELSLGQNILVAFMAWEGGNFEDAILISDRLIKTDRYSSIHIEDFSIDVRDTKLGPEMVTRDIPNVSEEKLKDLDAEGIIRLGAEVSSGDILVGKVTLKGETDLTAEEKLLRAIFGEEARDVKDTSLYLQHGERGKVVDVKVFSREQGDKLPV